MYKKNRYFTNSAYKKSLLRNMCKSLINHGHIATTVTKAKGLRIAIEKLITLGKEKTLHSKRQLISRLGSKSLKEVNKILNDISPAYKNVKGGYTRVIKIGYRKGDCAPMAIIQLVSYLSYTI